VADTPPDLGNRRRAGGFADAVRLALPLNVWHAVVVGSVLRMLISIPRRRGEKQHGAMRNRRLQPTRPVVRRLTETSTLYAM